MHTDQEWTQMTLNSFRRLPVDMRTNLVNHVRSIYSEDTEEIRSEVQYLRERIKNRPGSWIGWDHHGWGTWMRNSLRDVHTDDELPNTPYDDDRGEFKNYDDYYVGIVEVALKEGIYHMLNESEKI